MGSKVPEGQRQLTVRIDAELYQRLRYAAAAELESMTGYITRRLLEELPPGPPPCRRRARK